MSFVDSVELAFFINGLKDPAAQVPSWQSPTSGSFSIGRFYAQLQSGYKYRYFHGFLSDLYVFSRALNEEEIGQLMGKSLKAFILKVEKLTSENHSEQEWLSGVSTRLPPM